MRVQDKQTGASFIFWLVLLAIVGFAFTIGVRLAPIYIDAYTIQSVLEDVATEVKGSSGMSRDPNAIWSSIEKRLSINDIENIQRDDFIYTRDKSDITIEIKYEVQTQLIGNLDAVAKFQPVQILSAPAPTTQ